MCVCCSCAWPRDTPLQAKGTDIYSTLSAGPVQLSTGEVGVEDPTTNRVSARSRLSDLSACREPAFYIYIFISMRPSACTRGNAADEALRRLQGARYTSAVTLSL